MNRISLYHLLRVFLLTIGIATLISCAHKAHHSHAKTTGATTMNAAYSDERHSVTIESDEKLHRASLYSNRYPLPLGEIHSWTVRIENSDGNPLEDAKVFVHGGMPMHGHGFPTKPKVTEHLGNGTYKVEGIKFNMPGHWELRFTFEYEKGKSDRVVFVVHLL